ncbi:MAG: YqhA family protein, partial [Thiomonas arsenitoxydans]|nr:YqhA family protein [Thiomonas arsenitoxydans]
MKRVEHALEVLIFGSRWLLAPFYIGLVLGIVLLLVKFVKTFVGAVSVVFSGTGGEAMLAILSLVDIALVANLLIIIIFA